MLQNNVDSIVYFSSPVLLHQGLSPLAMRERGFRGEGRIARRSKDILIFLQFLSHLFQVGFERMHEAEQPGAVAGEAQPLEADIADAVELVGQVLPYNHPVLVV